MSSDSNHQRHFVCVGFRPLPPASAESAHSASAPAHSPLVNYRHRHRRRLQHHSPFPPPQRAKWPAHHRRAILRVTRRQETTRQRPSSRSPLLSRSGQVRPLPAADVPRDLETWCSSLAPAVSPSSPPSSSSSSLKDYLNDSKVLGRAAAAAAAVG